MLVLACVFVASSLNPIDCPSCDQVPCGQCQEGCPQSSNGCNEPSATSRNGCNNGNKGCHPNGCSNPDPPTPPLSPGASFCDDSAGWKRVWSDEFDEKLLDNATWTNDMGWDTLSALRDAKNTAENVWIENGTLVIRSQRQHTGPYTEGIPAKLYPNTTFNYTSAAVTTKGLRTFGGHGKTTRVCVRAQLPGGGGKGKGYWPAHWLLPEGCPAGCSPLPWPQISCSAAELDILEMVDGDGMAHATYHSQPNCSVSPHDLHDGTSALVGNFSSAWHEYAVQYSPTEAKFYIDGELLLDVPLCLDSAPNNTHCGHFFDVPYHLLLNTAIGGPWPQQPDAETEFPGHHRVDWVRVAQEHG
jgi:licheninase